MTNQLVDVDKVANVSTVNKLCDFVQSCEGVTDFHLTTNMTEARATLTYKGTTFTSCEVYALSAVVVVALDALVHFGEVSNV